MTCYSTPKKSSPLHLAGESDDTRFIMSRKGDEVQPALETAMKAKMAEELDGFLRPFFNESIAYLKTLVDVVCGYRNMLIVIKKQGTPKAVFGSFTKPECSVPASICSTIWSISIKE